MHLLCAVSVELANYKNARNSSSWGGQDDIFLFGDHFFQMNWHVVFATELLLSRDDSYVGSGEYTHLLVSL